MTAFSTEKNKSSESFILYCPLFAVPLHKISGTRQFESKLSLRSFALSLHKISCGIIFATLFQRNKDNFRFLLTTVS